MGALNSSEFGSDGTTLKRNLIKRSEAPIPRAKSTITQFPFSGISSVIESIAEPLGGGREERGWGKGLEPPPGVVIVVH